VLCHFCFFKYDTSRFYVDRIHNATNVKEVGMLETGLDCSLKMTYAEADVMKVREYLEVQYAIKTQVQKPTFRNMFTSQYIRRLRAVTLFQFFNEFSGINFFVLYGVTIFDDIGQNGAKANLVISMGRTLGAVVCIWSVGAFGGKTHIVVGKIGQAIAFSGLVAMKLTRWYGLLYPTCLFYIVSAAAGAAAAPSWMVATIPSVGIGMAIGVCALSNMFIGFFGPMMTNEWPGPIGTMVFFTFWCYAGIFALDWVVIETKGKQTDEIEKEYLNFKYRPFRLCPKKVED
jgi:hypothetical protein